MSSSHHQILNSINIDLATTGVWGYRRRGVDRVTHRATDIGTAQQPDVNRLMDSSWG